MMPLKKIIHLIEIGILSAISFLIIVYLVKTSNFSLEIFRDFLKENTHSYFLFGIILFFLLLLGVSSSFLIFLTSILIDLKFALLISFIALFLSSISAYQISNFVEHKLIEKYHFFYKFKFKFIEKIFNKVKDEIVEKTFIIIFVSQVIVSFVPSSYVIGIFKDKIKGFKFYTYTFINSLIYSGSIVFFGKIFLQLDYKDFLFLIFFGVILAIIIKKIHLTSKIKKYLI